MIAFTEMSPGRGRLDIRGTITDLLPEIPTGLDTIDVFIDSMGGDFYGGLSLYRSLMGCGAEVIGHISTAMSAATLPMMACREMHVDASTMVMVHGVTACGVDVNRRDGERLIRELGALDDQMAAIYASRSSIGKEQWLSLMEAESYFGPEEMKRYGLPVVEDGMDARHGFAYAASALFLKHLEAKMSDDKEIKAEVVEEDKAVEEPKAEVEENPVENPVEVPEESHEETHEEKPVETHEEVPVEAHVETTKEDRSDRAQILMEALLEAKAALDEVRAKQCGLYDSKKEPTAEEITKAERTRISGILAYEGIADKSLISAAIEDGLSVESFAKTVLDAQRFSAEARRKAICASRREEPVQDVVVSAEPVAERKVVRNASDKNRLMQKIFG